MGNELELNYPINKDGIAIFYGTYINPNSIKDTDKTFSNPKFGKNMEKEKC